MTEFRPRRHPALSDQEVETIYAAYESVLGYEARTIDGRRALVTPIYEAVIRARLDTAATNHQHYWIDAPDDETGWYCTICGVTEYPGGVEHEDHLLR